MSDELPVIPLNDLERGTHLMRAEIDSAVGRVLDRGYFILGPENAALEEELSRYLSVAATVLVGNGTDAIQLALSAVGVSAGDPVVTVANAGGYTSTAARSLGAVPVYADVESADQLASLATIQAAIVGLATAPKAIVVTHLFGATVDVEPIVGYARDHGIAIVEDCAQALGASRAGRKVGTFGTIATTSFYPTKNLGALGDAGAVMTSSPELAARVRQLRQYGWEAKYQTTLAGGINSRLDEMQAAILREKLPHLDDWNSRRRNIHRQYEAAVGPGARFVTTSQDGFIGHLAVIEVADRASAQAVFEAARIKTDVHYPIPDHLQPLLADQPRPSLPVTERAADNIISVPLFPELHPEEVARVCSALATL